MTDDATYDFSGLKATFLNCTLKRSPEPSHTEGLVDASVDIMRKQGGDVTVLRPIDHDIATGPSRHVLARMVAAHTALSASLECARPSDGALIHAQSAFPATH
ncbi:MAG: hypothetical protein WKF79_11870 [Nocardioides sp.]